MRPPCPRSVRVSLGLTIALAFGGILAVAHAQDAADTQLEIEIRLAPGLAPERYVLGCKPPSGNVRDPAGACDRIAKLGAKATPPSGGGESPFATPGPPPDATACPQIYGGPEVALVQGRFWGAPLTMRLTRENGCTMSTYDATMKLLGIP